MGYGAPVHRHGILCHVAFQDHDAYPGLLGALHLLPELPVRGVVRNERVHALHLNYQDEKGLVAFADALLQAPQMLQSPLCRGVREHADAVMLQRHPLDLGEYPPLPRLHIEVEAGVAMSPFRENRRRGAEASGRADVFHESGVRSLRVDVDQQIAFISCNQVVCRLARGVVRFGQHGLNPRHEYLATPARVLHVHGLDHAADVDLGDEPVWPRQKSPGFDALVSHVPSTASVMSCGP